MWRKNNPSVPFFPLFLTSINYLRENAQLSKSIPNIVDSVSNSTSLLFLSAAANPTIQQNAIDFIESIPEGPPSNFSIGGVLGSELGEAIRDKLR